MSVTTGMVGHGFYNRNSAPQMSSIEHVLPWLDAAVADIALDNATGTIGLADFGCSEGRNSISVMRHLVPALRRRTSRPILTVHSDLPTNDFSTLFTDLRPDGPSVFGDPEVFSCAVGGSMFDRLLPPASLHLAFSFNAIGFLSRRPLERLPGYILPNGPSRIRGVGTVTEAERRIFSTQASRDVASFLRARAAELVPGGKLLIEVFGAGETLRTCDGIYDVLNDAVLELVAARMIDRAAYEAYYQPVYFRTLEELTRPVAADGLPFRIDRQETYEAPVPFNEEFARSGDIVAYARDYTNFHRAFTEGVLRLAFATHPTLDALVSDVYARAERLVREAPDRYPFNYIAVAALMSRTSD
jgi:gibberellin A4 carboxyl methyltransferase